MQRGKLAIEAEKRKAAERKEAERVAAIMHPAPPPAAWLAVESKREPALNSRLEAVTLRNARGETKSVRINTMPNGVFLLETGKSPVEVFCHREDGKTHYWEDATAMREKHAYLNQSATVDVAREASEKALRDSKTVLSKRLSRKRAKELEEKERAAAAAATAAAATTTTAAGPPVKRAKNAPPDDDIDAAADAAPSEEEPAVSGPATAAAVEKPRNKSSLEYRRSVIRAREVLSHHASGEWFLFAESAESAAATVESAKKVVAEADADAAAAADAAAHGGGGGGGGNNADEWPPADELDAMEAAAMKKASTRLLHNAREAPATLTAETKAHFSKHLVQTALHSVCRTYAQTGSCVRGTGCPNSHETDGRVPVTGIGRSPAPAKNDDDDKEARRRKYIDEHMYVPKGYCWNFYDYGKCPTRESGECKRVHLRPNDMPFKKKGTCKFFAKSGRCFRSDKCEYTHEASRDHIPVVVVAADAAAAAAASSPFDTLSVSLDRKQKPMRRFAT